MSGILVTGMQRSGTTLLEKLLGQQDGVSMLSQPFPLLYVEAKRAFLRELGIDEAYPLGHLFGEARYTNADFTRFLSRWRTTRDELAALFEIMARYSGQYTRFTPAQLGAAHAAIGGGDDFAAVASILVRDLASRGGARWFGSKEATCEEFVPYLLDRGFRCAIIVRDPRDVVASLNTGSGRAYGGEIKPTLFNVRSWRKSVAFARACEGRPRFFWCRYRDLVRDPGGTLRSLAAALELDVDIGDVAELREPSGAPWTGNSSHVTHDGVTAASVNAYQDRLPPEVSRFIEAACLPELRRLGYETTLTEDEAVRVLQDFREPFDTRASLAADRATSDNLQAEVERLLSGATETS